MWVKLKTPVSHGHGHRGGVKVYPSQQFYSAAKFEDILRTLTNNAVSSETKQHVLNRAVSQCPSNSMEVLGQKIPCLLDLGSMVTLIHDVYFKKNILPLLNKSTGDLTEAHSFIWLSAANNEVMPVSKYFEADVTLLSFTVPNVGFLVFKDPNTLLQPQHNTRLLGVIGCNLIWLGCEEFSRVYGFEALKKFRCLDNVNPMIFAQMCSFYHQDKLSSPQTGSTKQNLDSIKVNTLGISSKGKNKNPSSGSEAVLGQVLVGSTHEAICIPANSKRVLQGKTNKIT